MQQVLSNLEGLIIVSQAFKWLNDKWWWITCRIVKCKQTYMMMMMWMWGEEGNKGAQLSGFALYETTLTPSGSRAGPPFKGPIRMQAWTCACFYMRMVFTWESMLPYSWARLLVVCTSVCLCSVFVNQCAGCVRLCVLWFLGRSWCVCEVCVHVCSNNGPCWGGASIDTMKADSRETGPIGRVGAAN